MSMNRKKRILIAVVATFLIVASAIGGAVYGKYSTTMNKQNQIIAEAFKLFSPDLSTNSNPSPVSVMASSKTVSISNGTDETNVSTIDISYTVHMYYGDYSTDSDTVWTEVGTGSTFSFPASEGWKTKNINVTPVTISSHTYDSVKLVVVCNTFSKTMTGIFTFAEHIPFEVVYDTTHSEYIGVKIITNSDSGVYTLSWIEDVLPDGSDVNGILNSALEGPSNVSPSLDSFTVYDFVFFITSEIRAELTNETHSANYYISVEGPNG